MAACSGTVLGLQHAVEVVHLQGARALGSGWKQYDCDCYGRSPRSAAILTLHAKTCHGYFFFSVGQRCGLVGVVLYGRANGVSCHGHPRRNKKPPRQTRSLLRRGVLHRPPPPRDHARAVRRQARAPRPHRVPWRLAVWPLPVRLCGCGARCVQQISQLANQAGDPSKALAGWPQLVRLYGTLRLDGHTLLHGGRCGRL
ncbi:hypothetical protein SETIT_9G043800v2 [Setaria italica]|uniref:Uncharacterized protein n=1 Tax=Setaria italica TaxID=4555 RepID=A0A368SD02_SETIT|nr:hypothetical protein SETIT_9G043800v2 [Setaria italica]